MARKIEVEIVGDSSSYQRALGSAQKQTSKFGALAKTALIGGAAAGMYALGKAAKIGWDEYNQGAKVAAQTNAVIKSTGGVANVTAQHVEDLGHALMLKSGMDDEAIKSGENIILTFRNIRNEVGKGNDIFDKATKLTQDLAVAMGVDMSSAALQVGKALNDPAKGLTRLTRIGVQFTQQQSDQIIKLSEAGKTMEAQKIILRELSREFGGSAKAAGQTFGGQLSILRERLNNFLGDLTERAIPSLQKFIKWVGPILSRAMARASEIAAILRQRWAELGAVLKQHQDTVRVLAKVIGFASKAASVWIKWQIILWGTILKVDLAVVRLALTIGDKLIAAIHKVAGPAKAAFNAVATAVRIAISPILLMISAIHTLINAINSIPTPHLPSLPGGGGLLSYIHRAAGGPVSAGRAYVVGERGPELMVPRSNGTIIPNGAGAGGSVNVIVLGGDRGAIEWLRGLDARSGRRSGRGIL